MCEQILSNTLEGKIQTDSLLKWLDGQDVEDCNCHNELKENRCLQSDFILYFLNFIHDVQPLINNKSIENIQKVSTPKKVDRNDNASVVTPISKKHLAQFENNSENSGSNLNFVHSTPKVKSQGAMLDESYASPLSPLYNKQNFITPRSKYTNSTLKTTPTHSFCLGDFIVGNNNSKPSFSKKRVQRNLNENLFNIGEENSNGRTAARTRRINPTSLTQRKFSNANFRKSDNSFTFENGNDEIIDHSNGQRSFLVEERMKIMSRKNSTSNNSPSLAKSLAMSRKKEVTPLFRLVSFKQQLDVLVSIYCFMLDNNFVLNVANELYFLFSLFLSREYEENDDASPNNSSNLGVGPLLDDSVDSCCDKNKNDSKFSSCTLFATIHNRVYFACETIQNQLHILNVFDRSTLRILIENNRLRNFTATHFISQLSHIYENKTEKTSAGAETLEEQIQSNVCFISDTDNRGNFPTDPSFHAFRKQRDLFYDILRVWEKHHFQEDWNFPVALGGKVKALLNMHPDYINLVHLARLFKAQLLKNTCGNNEDNDNAVGENQLSFLSSIPNVDTEKLFRLKSRIVSKHNGNGGINALPVFNGYQEFYHDFILVSPYHAFTKHLNDALVSEIVDLNNTKFSSDFYDNDGQVDSSTQNSYTLCIKSLRILAKFLGFLQSLPYKNDNGYQLPQHIVSCQINIRNQTHPGFDLKTIISNSIIKKSLVLTIPWVTKYLSMLDYVTLRLPYFEEILYMLFDIYFDLKNQKNHQSNVFLLKLCMGWLFELPHFPENFYYKFLSHRLPARNEADLKHTTSKSKIFLDELDLVDQNVLHVCCPYLANIKKILSDSMTMLNNSNVTVKHITPLTAVDSPTDLSNKRLQLQLEEAFFNSHPVSVRKTVEFISERVASASVKQICNEIVPSYKKAVLVDLKVIFNSIDVPDNICDDEDKCDTAKEKIKVMLNLETSKLAISSLKGIREHINKELKNFLSARITSAINALLATDVFKQVKVACSSIAFRMCEERVQQWINSHVNIGIFLKDFDVEVKQFLANCFLKKIKHKPLFALPLFGKDLEHKPHAFSGVEIVEEIRSHCWTVLEKPHTISLEVIDVLIKSVHQSINERCDLNDCILVLINKMLIDFFILLVSNRPNLIIDSNMAEEFCSVWKRCSYNQDSELFKTLVCPRNVLMISHSLNVDMSWKSFEKFVLTLLNEGLLTQATFEKQILTINWNKFDEVATSNLSKCLQLVRFSHT